MVNDECDRDGSQFKKNWYMRFDTRFFDKHEIRVLEKRDFAYVYLFLRLLNEAVVHQGYLRYSEKSPYTADRLASLFLMPIKTVEEGIKAIIEEELMEQLEDGTLFVPLAQSMSGCSVSGSERTKNWRDRKKVQSGGGEGDDTMTPESTPRKAPAATQSAPAAPSQPVTPSAALPAEDPLVSQQVYAPKPEEVVYGAKQLEIPEDYAKGWHTYMSQQDWCFVSAKGQSTNVNRRNFKSILRRFYDFDKRKAAEGRQPTVTCSAFTAPAPLSAAAAAAPATFGAITEEFFFTKVMAMNKGITRSERITEYEARTIYADFKMCEWLNFKGERITPENLAYNIKTKQQFMRANGDGGYDPSDYDPEDDPERKTPEYITQEYEHRISDFPRLDAERLVIMKNTKLRVEERFEAQETTKALHAITLRYFEIYEAKIAEYERKNGAKWPLKRHERPYKGYETYYSWCPNAPGGERWEFYEHPEDKTPIPVPCARPQKAINAFLEKYGK